MEEYTSLTIRRVLEDEIEENANNLHIPNYNKGL